MSEGWWVAKRSDSGAGSLLKPYAPSLITHSSSLDRLVGAVSGMVRELLPLDISDFPDLQSLVSEVRASNLPRLLRAGDEDLAILSPAKPSRRSRKHERTQADREAFLASAGGWKELVDTAQLKNEIAASREASTRPPVQL